MSATVMSRRTGDQLTQDVAIDAAAITHVAVLQLSNRAVVTIKNPDRPGQIMLPSSWFPHTEKWYEVMEERFQQLTGFATSPVGWAQRSFMCQQNDELWYGHYEFQLSSDFAEFFNRNVVLVQTRADLESWTIYPPHQEALFELLESRQS